MQSFVEFGFGEVEDFAEGVVEAFGHVARHFDVLDLVFADGNDIGIVDEDIGGHEDWVSKQAVAFFAGSTAVFGGFPSVSAFQEPHIRHAAQDPSEFGDLWQIRLSIEYALVGIEPKSEEISRDSVRIFAHACGIVNRRHGVIIGDEIATIV